MFDPHIALGATLTNTEVHRVFSVGNMGGIHSTGTSILVFNTRLALYTLASIVWQNDGDGAVTGSRTI